MLVVQLITLMSDLWQKVFTTTWYWLQGNIQSCSQTNHYSHNPIYCCDARLATMTTRHIMHFSMVTSWEKFTCNTLSFQEKEKSNNVWCLKRQYIVLNQHLMLSTQLLNKAYWNLILWITKSDFSLFVYHNSPLLVYCLVYVNDLIIMRNNSSFMADLTDHLGQKFSHKDLGLYTSLLA